MERFWVVLMEHPGHDNRDSAKQEALELAKKNPGAKYYVAAVTGVAHVPAPDPSWEELRSPKPYGAFNWRDRG